MTLEQLCTRIDTLIQRLDRYAGEREAYRDALLQVICAATIHDARRVARQVLAGHARKDDIRT